MFAHTLIIAYVEYRLLQEGASTRDIVVKRKYQGSGEFEKFLLSVEYTAPFESCENALKTPQPGPDCTAKNANGLIGCSQTLHTIF